MRLLCTLVLLLLTGLCRGDEIRVSAAASLKNAICEIVEAFQRSTGHLAAPTFGASGMLLTQIKAGAPVDVFISAGQRQVDELVAAKLAATADVNIIAGNRLMVVVPEDTANVPESLRALADRRFARIAVGARGTVPAGQYAAEALAAAELEETLKPRFIVGANVRQVLDYVGRGEVDAGFVYSTDVQDAGRRVRVAFAVDPALHSPITYPAAIISNSAHRDTALMFCQFLGSEPAQKILLAHGFTAPSSLPPPRAPALPESDASP